MRGLERDGFDTDVISVPTDEAGDFNLAAIARARRSSGGGLPFLVFRMILRCFGDCCLTFDGDWDGRGGGGMCGEDFEAGRLLDLPLA